MFLKNGSNAYNKDFDQTYINTCFNLLILYFFLIMLCKNLKCKEKSNFIFGCILKYLAILLDTDQKLLKLCPAQTASPCKENLSH